MKLTILKGLPASGKSALAKEMVDKNPNNVKRINKDLLREMLDCGHYTKKSEGYIIKTRDQLILAALEAGKNVIVDDTNLNPIHEVHIRDMLQRSGLDYEVEVIFVNTPLEECIKRDLNRHKSVGEKVIRDMYKKWLRTETKVEATAVDSKLPHCIIVDIDGTIAEMGDRSPYDWNKVSDDTPHEIIIDLVYAYNLMAGVTVKFLSGRDASCFDATYEWLTRQFEYEVLDPSNLHMRSAGDMRKDSVVKEELYRENIEGKFNVDFVLDDRNQVVEMWRSLGLRCLQVAEGDF